MVVVKKVPVPHMLEIGLKRAGLTKERQKCHKTNIERFRGFYGCSPESAREMYHDIQTRAPVGRTITRPNIDHFLMALFWLFGYNTE